MFKVLFSHHWYIVFLWRIAKKFWCKDRSQIVRPSHCFMFCRYRCFTSPTLYRSIRMKMRHKIGILTMFRNIRLMKLIYSSIIIVEDFGKFYWILFDTKYSWLFITENFRLLENFRRIKSVVLVVCDCTTRDRDYVSQNLFYQIELLGIVPEIGC